MGNLSDKINLVNELDSGKGIQNMLDAAYEILGNPIAMFDTEYRLQAYTRIVTDDILWNELVTLGSFSYESQVLFMETGFIDAVANCENTVLLESDKVKYARIHGKLYNSDNIHVANLIIVACNKPFSDDDQIIYQALCVRFSKEVTKSDFYKTYGNMYQETYIRKLIDGEIVKKALYAAHIAIIYSNFKTNLRLIVADIGRKDKKEYSKLTYYRDLFRKTQNEFEYAIYKNYIVIIISSDYEQFDPCRDLGKLYNIFTDYNIYCGISSSFDNLYELRKYYIEAEKTLEEGFDVNSDELLFLYQC